MVAGAHTMAITAPALAEQDRMSREAEAAAERAVVPAQAGSDGVPVPALLGGIVLAFAVGLSVGHVQRRRRLARRSAEARERPAPAPTPAVTARPAPPPPPPPPSVRSSGPRILRFRQAPPPPAPPAPEPEIARSERTADAILRPEPAAEQAPPEIVAPEPEPAEEAPPEIVAPEPEPAEEARPEIVAPEPEPAPAEGVVERDEVVPPAREQITPPPHEQIPPPPREHITPSPREEFVRPELPRVDAGAPPVEPPATPLAQAPESLLRPGQEPAAEAEIVALPARRFARAQPWPEQAETLWTCEIAWKAGYLKSTFRAMAGPPGAARRKSIGESPSLRWTLMTDPEPPTTEMIASVKVLVSALVEAGWEHSGHGAAWYSQRFLWRGSGEPRPVSVPGEIEAAEPPSR